MNSLIPAPLPPELLCVDGSQFTSSGTQYLIQVTESDISRLVLTDRGTCFDPNKPPVFELRVYEYDPASQYKGLSGQFKNLFEIVRFYDVKRENISKPFH